MRRKIPRNSESKTDQNRYLITYADLLTLLFALFIILYSISKPDQEKMNEVLRAMNNVFNPTQIIEGNNMSPDVSSQKHPPLIMFQSKPLTIPEVQNEIETKLARLIANNTIGFEKTPDGVKLKIPNELLFKSADATINEENKSVLDSIGAVLADIDMQILVDGHTDNVPIKSATYSSNWELSAARSVSILHTLVGAGVPEHNLVARSYGSQRPVADNMTAEGREKNRRVEITIIPKEASAATTSNDTQADTNK
jgi:chemotaxis protein MotB